MAYKEIAEIKPAPDGKFEFDNGKRILICYNADDVGECLEQQLWPLVAPLLKVRKPMTITITEGTTE